MLDQPHKSALNTIEQGKILPLRRDWLFILLAPIAAVPLFGICLINQDRYVDPWLYTGYSRMLKPLVDIYGWRYYGIRFPVVGLMSLFAAIFKEPLNFIFLRYCIYAATAFVLYRFACRTLSKRAGLAAIVTLAATPQFAQILLWDVSSFLAIPAAIIGICLWLLPTQRPAAMRFAAGFMFAAAVNSHAFVATTIAAFLLVEFIADWCASKWKQFAAKLAWALLGGVACVAVGLLYYNLAVGGIGPRTLFEVTLASIKLGLDYHLQVQFSTADILTHHFPIYLPLLLTALNGALLGKRIISTIMKARIFWFSLMYYAFFLVFHIVGGRNVLGFVHYVAFLFPTVLLQIPIIIDELTPSVGELKSRPPAVRNAAGVFIACIAIIPLLNNWVTSVNRIFNVATISPHTIVVVAALAVGALGFTIASSRVGMLRPAAAAMLALCIQAALFSSDRHLAVFSSIRAPREFAVYSAADDLIRLAQEYNKPRHRMRMWYPKGDTSMYGLSFVTIDDGSIQSPHSVLETGMPSIGDFERAKLAAGDTAYVLLIAHTGDSIEAGMNALRSAGFPFEVKIKTVLGPDPAFQEKAVLVALRR